MIKLGPDQFFAGIKPFIESSAGRTLHFTIFTSDRAELLVLRQGDVLLTSHTSRGEQRCSGSCKHGCAKLDSTHRSQRLDKSFVIF